jgi:hypothetical protein
MKNKGLRPVKLEILADGNLLVKVDNRKEFNEIAEAEYTNGDADRLWSLLECRYLGNDWWTDTYFVAPEQPCICMGAIYEDYESSFSPDGYENVWIYKDFQKNSFVDILKNEGEVVFNRYTD